MPTDDLFFTAALAAELGKKTGLCWVRVGGRSHPVWHVWHDDVLCLVSGGDEQPLLELVDGDRVEVVMRSKETGGWLLTWDGQVSVVHPGDERWSTTTSALVAGRLNLADPATAAAAWARSSTVHRIAPVHPPTR
ncbi:MAG: hypothetical protein ABI776_05940 [Nocardioidaceae bacterium]